MPSLHFILHFIFAFFLFSCPSNAQTIIVDKGGNGNFSSVQKAIDSVPPNTNSWTHIYIKSGIYEEKVVIPGDKPFIFLQGESKDTTSIEWGESGSSTQSATFTLNADNFVAADLSFKNTYNLALSAVLDDQKPILWAPAATIYGDKASFYNCSFFGVQDTLTDAQGRHYYKSCYIEGAIDFIWGRGQSVYEGCVLNATTGALGKAGYITAQGRESSNDTSGFVFLSCSIYGTGPVDLGRAYRQFSRVVFRNTYMSDVVQPEGWSAWSFVGKEKDIVYSEVSCSGPGADKSKRVKWEKNLTTEELKQLEAKNFINQDGWIQGQPQVK
ncbi:hypothetical protein MANES_09G177300v8 [Manihot esculenta]|uniref:pectinesterase n=1 Tax=Manihot esculenta TaxID=3983 RepID=A0A2C9VBP3_MANES|nr:hypothetical protein MANES_09G177300v8 [Manihot esculenta]